MFTRGIRSGVDCESYDVVDAAFWDSGPFGHQFSQCLSFPHRQSE